jgi:molybdenum cofactor cytidylyltransferase
VRTCGIVLAAGAGTRFGGGKQLALLDGRPLLEHAVAAACAASLDRVVVVLGDRADEVRAAVDFGRAEPLVCADWAEGLSASLRCGLAAAGDERAVITLGDEPALPPAAIDAVLAVEGPAVRATWGGRPGHPVAIEPGLARSFQLRGDTGLRALLAGAVEVECRHLGRPVDVDTRSDLEAMQR